MPKTGGILDERNPFVRESWIEQGYGLTSNRSNRRAKLEILFGKTVDEIHQYGNDNLGRYPARIGLQVLALTQHTVLKWK